MMTNLFSVFDPASSMGVGLNWVSLVLSVCIFPMVKWGLDSRGVMFLKSVLFFFQKETNPLLISKGKITFLIFNSVFFFILMNNLMGLVPYVFTSTAHLMVTLSLALPLWLGYFFYGWFSNLSSMLAHLTPQGTPFILMPFMVLIESVSSLIRPSTLAVRLMANMIAGHLLLSLISSAVQVFSIMSVVLMTLSQVLMVTLEVAVAMIQAYVLVILSVLYSSEV